MNFFIETTATALLAILLVPTVAQAACTQGPDVVVNRGHGASITFDEPVYQAQVFDVSRLMLEPIPPHGTRTLILTEVEAQHFPGLPTTPTTSLLATAGSGQCFSFNITFGTAPFHYSVSATAASTPDVTTRSTLLPGGQDIDIARLRTEYEKAVTEFGASNTFLQRVGQFLSLVDAGTSQRLAAQQAGVEWSHLLRLAQELRPEDSTAPSVFI